MLGIAGLVLLWFRPRWGLLAIFAGAITLITIALEFGLAAARGMDLSAIPSDQLFGAIAIDVVQNLALLVIGGVFIIMVRRNFVSESKT